jgi:hypothetical protein
LYLTLIEVQFFKSTGSCAARLVSVNQKPKPISNSLGGPEPMNQTFASFGLMAELCLRVSVFKQLFGAGFEASAAPSMLWQIVTEGI